ncbi:MAG: MCP four helix bundle domain-containing protein [Alphaproteobacteria bacterium]
MKNLTIVHRLVIGFAAIVLLLAAAAALTLWQVGTLKDGTDRIVYLRAPTAQASSNMVSNIHASLASLRGWMLTGNSEFKLERAAVWSEIAKNRAAMDDLSKNWTNPKNIENWGKFKVILDAFSLAQMRVEAIAYSADERPATKILLRQAMSCSRAVLCCKASSNRFRAKAFSLKT